MASMLRLTLVRHAKAAPADSGQEDWDRALEPRGQRDAPQMGQRLRDRGLKPERILSSPALRALTTATLIGRELGIGASRIEQEERLYLAMPKDILRVLQELGGAARHLMLVGHNPGLTEFAERISADRPLDNLPTCAVYTLEFALADWAKLEWASGVNAELDYPKRSA